MVKVQTDFQLILWLVQTITKNLVLHQVASVSLNNLPQSFQAEFLHCTQHCRHTLEIYFWRTKSHNKRIIQIYSTFRDQRLGLFIMDHCRRWHRSLEVFQHQLLFRYILLILTFYNLIVIQWTCTHGSCRETLMASLDFRLVSLLFIWRIVIDINYFFLNKYIGISYEKNVFQYIAVKIIWKLNLKVTLFIY